MPGVQMPSEHHDFLFFVCARNLRDRVVRGLPFRVDLVDDVELELHRGSVGEDP
jgi:hypothetical protein